MSAQSATVSGCLAYCEHGYAETEYCRTCEIIGAPRPFFHPEPPRNSGEADAVHGPTALRTHQDNTHTTSPIDPGARP